jgi:hypothetical protein
MRSVGAFRFIAQSGFAALQQFSRYHADDARDTLRVMRPLQSASSDAN